MKLLTVDTLSKAREKLLDCLQETKQKIGKVELLSAEGKILAEEIKAEYNVPLFDRSSVDGYAVRVQDVAASSESIPSFLTITGEVLMGQACELSIHPGEAIYVPTGGMIPKGADAVVMVEYCEAFDATHIAVYNSAASGENIVRAGEDVKAGQTLFSKGTYLDARTIGVLASLGIDTCQVYEPFRMAVISTGDELCPVGEKLRRGQVYDINTNAISAKAMEEGFIVTGRYVLDDEEDKIRATIISCMKENDFVIVSGGSSQGKKDVTAKIMDEVADSKVLTHGIALKPGKPTITAYDQKSETILIGLPGHPAAALIVFDLLVVWLKNRLTGQKERPLIPAIMEHNVASAPGRMTCQMVTLKKQDFTYIATPVYGKSGLMTTLTESDGYVLIGQNEEGVKSKEPVMVHLL